MYECGHGIMRRRDAQPSSPKSAKWPANSCLELWSLADFGLLALKQPATLLWYNESSHSRASIRLRVPIHETSWRGNPRGQDRRVLPAARRRAAFTVRLDPA